MKKTELSWCGGFFDGEGSFTLNNNRPYMQITQIDKEVLTRFKKAVGFGTIYSYKKRSYQKHATFYYRASGQEALDVFEKIKPFISRLKIRQGAVVERKFKNRQ